MMENIFERSRYVKKIRSDLYGSVIKVITGVRYCGKSTLLREIEKLWIEEDVKNENILFIDKESFEWEVVLDGDDLAKCVKDVLHNVRGKRYVVVNEVHKIVGWEKGLLSFFDPEKYDVYISGSNTGVLSEEFKEIFSEKYIEIPIYTFGFEEYLFCNVIGMDGLPQGFRDYMKFGGFPGLHHLKGYEEMMFRYLGSVYDTIILRDVIARSEVRNLSVVWEVGQYLFDNMGKTLSVRKIVDYLKERGLKVATKTVRHFLESLVQSYALYKIKRYDVVNERYLDYSERYYWADIGLRNGMLGYYQVGMDGLLKNIVFLELKRMGYEVLVGKIGEDEVDFVVIDGHKKHYIHVVHLLGNSKDQIFAMMDRIRDHYPKYILSIDAAPEDAYEGIECLNVVDFLLYKTL